MVTNLNVLVVGAGIGGLTAAIALKKAGSRVTLIEQAATLSEVGAGIQLPPNASRILRHLGLLERVQKCATRLSGLVVRRYADDSEIGPRSYSGQTQSNFDAPMLMIHRADLQRILADAAAEAGIEFRSGSRVQKIDSAFEAKVYLASGECITGDVVIAADGIRSRTRAQMAAFWGIKDAIVSTGDAAYRVTIPRSDLVEHQDILDMMDSAMSTRWVGPGGHIIAYPLRGGSIYNVVMVHPADNDCLDESNIWTRRGYLEELNSFYGSWSPIVRSIAENISPDRLLQWPLNRQPHLPAWHVNRVCLLGDAAHAMLPYVAQGSAQAIEDAAALMVCLTTLNSVPQALSLYETMRKSRAEYIQDIATDLRKILHVPDGPEQEKRDATMRAPRTPDWKHPDPWADPDFHQYVWGYDVTADAKSRCSMMVAADGIEDAKPSYSVTVSESAVTVEGI